MISNNAVILIYIIILSNYITSASSYGFGSFTSSRRNLNLFSRKLHLYGKTKTEQQEQTLFNATTATTNVVSPVLVDSITIRLQNYLRDSGTLRFVVDALTRTVAGPAFYYENPHCFSEFIRISEYPHWLATATSSLMGTLFNVTDPNELSISTATRSDDFSTTCTNVRARIHFKKEAYYHHDEHDSLKRKQRAQVMVPETLKHRKDLPILFFFHGGVWGSGFATMYRLIAKPFLKRNYRVIVLGYRTYPDATLGEQMEDLVQAVEYFKTKYSPISTLSSVGDDGGSSPGSGSNTGDGNTRAITSRPPIVLIGHSSGAHVAMMAVLKGHLSSRNLDALIGMSGVYDLELAREFELQQGLTELSPMGPVCGITTATVGGGGGFTNDIDGVSANTYAMRENSPSWLASSCEKEILSSFPQCLLIHGEDDTVAPPIYSRVFHEVLNENYNKRGRISTSASMSPSLCQLEILEGVQHQDTVLETCLGRGKTQAKIFRWLAKTLV